MDRGAWRSTVGGLAEWDMTEHASTRKLGISTTLLIYYVDYKAYTYIFKDQVLYNYYVGIS